MIRGGRFRYRQANHGQSRGEHLRAEERDIPTHSQDLRSSGQRAGKAFQALSMASVGLEMGLAVVVGWGIGQWLDGKLGTAPYLMLLFLLFGIGAAFKGLIRAGQQAKRAARESDG